MPNRPKTVVYIATTLDGFIARLDGDIDWLGEPEEDDDEDYGWADFIVDVDRIVMGRATFEKLLSFDTWWPYENTPITVLSTTMLTLPKSVPLDLALSSLDPGSLLEHLGKQGCRRVYVDGGKTVQSFLSADLIDELIITNLPVLIGEGIPLFGPLPSDLRWELGSVDTFKKGLVKRTYQRRR